MQKNDQAHPANSGKFPTMVLIVLFVFLVLVVRAWPDTWDDSGITLAFSKNLATLADIVPTALPPRFEGYI